MAYDPTRPAPRNWKAPTLITLAVVWLIARIAVAYFSGLNTGTGALFGLIFGAITILAFISFIVVALIALFTRKRH